MLTLAIIHLETRVGPFRLSVSEDLDGTLIIERSGSEEPYGFPVQVAAIDPSEAGHTEDINNLVQIAVRDIESFAGKVIAAHQVPATPEHVHGTAVRSLH